MSDPRYLVNLSMDERIVSGRDNDSLHAELTHLRAENERLTVECARWREAENRPWVEREMVIAMAVAPLKAELAAERERAERYNAMAGKDADELARLRESGAALAAALEKEQKNGLALACIILSGSIGRTAKEAERLLADQRRKGAAWALREEGCNCDVWPNTPVERHLPSCRLARAAAIESGEVEVPNGD